MIDLIPDELALLAHYTKALCRHLWFADKVIAKTTGLGSARLTRVIRRFNDKRGEAHEFIQEMIDDMNEHYDSQPIEWTEGVEGQSYLQWIIEWEECSGALVEPISIVKPAAGHLDPLAAIGRIDTLPIRPRADQ